jgi:anti-sigma factor RsiW
MHLDEERLQRMLHDELSPTAREVAVVHLESCDGCRARLDHATRLESRIFGALETIDTPPPLRLLTVHPQARRRGPWYRRLIAVSVLGIAGIAYAAPRSPLRSFVDRVTRRPSATRKPDSLIARQGQSTSGIALAPGPRLEIEIDRVTESDIVTVAIVDRTDEDAVVLRAVGGRPAFQTSADRVIVKNVDGVGALTIDIPRTAAHVEIRVGPTRLFVKDGLDVITSIRPDAKGRYALPFAASRPSDAIQPPR